LFILLTGMLAAVRLWERRRSVRKLWVQMCGHLPDNSCSPKVRYRYDRILVLVR
jgi:hypothetical protein